MSLVYPDYGCFTSNASAFLEQSEAGSNLDFGYLEGVEERCTNRRGLGIY